jgi:type III secretion protein HrpB1
MVTQMEALIVDHSDAATLARTIVTCIGACQLDEAQLLLDQLYDGWPETREILTFEVMIALKRGQTQEAWQLINGLPDERCPELKALCLRMLNDPTWHGYAEAHESNPDPYVRKAMRQLLGRPAEADGDAPGW